MDITAVRNDPAYRQIDLEYVEFAEADDIWVRAYSIPKAKTVLSQHVHTHDHITLVSRGTVEAWQDGEWFGEFSSSFGSGDSSGFGHSNFRCGHKGKHWHLITPRFRATLVRCHEGCVGSTRLHRLSTHGKRASYLRKF